MNKISLVEVMFLAVAVTVSTAVMFTPYLAAQAAGTDAWISVLVSGVLAIIPAWATAALMAKFPKKSIVQALPAIFGTVLGKLITLAYAGYFLIASALAVWRLEAFTVRFLLPDTPQIVIRAVFLLIVAYAALSGPTSLIRVSSYIVPVGVLVIILVIGLPMGRMDFNFLFPLFENGYERMVSAAIMLLGWLCQVPIVVLMYQRLVEGKLLKNAVSKAVLGVIVSTFALELGAAGTLAVLGPEQTASMYYPAFQVARIISIGSFLEHIEVFFVAVWIAGIFLAAAFFVQALSDTVADLASLRSKFAKITLYVALILILAAWPMLFKNLSFLVMISFIRDYGSWAGIIMGGILPVLMLSRVLIVPPKGKNQVSEEPGSKDRDSDGPSGVKSGGQRQGSSDIGNSKELGSGASKDKGPDESEN